MSKVFKTKHGKTELKCINLPATGDTLVIAPKYKKTRIQYIIVGQQIAEEIVTDKKTRAVAFKNIQENYELYKATLAI